MLRFFSPYGRSEGSVACIYPEEVGHVRPSAIEDSYLVKPLLGTFSKVQSMIFELSITNLSGDLTFLC